MKYSIEEIRYYLEGNKMIGNSEIVNDWNVSLSNSIRLLEDYEDGIEAVILRKNKYEDKNKPVFILFIKDVARGAKTLFKRKVRK